MNPFFFFFEQMGGSRFIQPLVSVPTPSHGFPGAAWVHHFRRKRTHLSLKGKEARKPKDLSQIYLEWVICPERGLAGGSWGTHGSYYGLKQT